MHHIVQKMYYNINTYVSVDSVAPPDMLSFRKDKEGILDTSRNAVFFYEQNDEKAAQIFRDIYEQELNKIKNIISSLNHAEEFNWKGNYQYGSFKRKNS